MHQKMRDKIESKINQYGDLILSGTAPHDDKGAISKARIIALEIEGELSKLKPYYLTAGEVFQLFISSYVELMGPDESKAHMNDTPLKNSFDKARVERFFDRQRKFLLSQPIEYEFLFPIPHIPAFLSVNKDELQANDGKVIAKFISSDTIPQSRLAGILGLANSANSYEPFGWYVLIRAFGYHGYGFGSSASRKALEIYKIFLFLLQACGFLQKDSHRANTPVKRRIVQIGCISVPDLLSNANEELSMSICSCVEPYSFTKNANIYSILTTDDDCPHIFNGMFEKLLLIASNFSGKYDAVVAASHWAFESMSDENETYAFIKACIAMEALFGDIKSNDKKRLLADRYSYFLGRDRSEREHISQVVRDAYDIRNKLVHGSATRIEAENRSMLGSVISILSRAISREVTA